ncbi:lysophospholipase [Ginsengibacter hankyongi]|uniref:Lysophospholipase n=1 Tax=Ginsengibacter hankyongi TaxID=2607284 RepID=A0A5J5ILI9_9BACT|nr:alpha/beta fold hydrolase [Ginsengibacter hankyongi]KAA9041408.1 lysophospholipase [Ginsengibacter hankyongi]
MKKDKVTRSRKQKIIRWTKIGIFIYGVTGIALYYFQEKLLLHPTPLSFDYQFKFNVPFKEVNIPLNATDNLNLVQFLPNDSTRKGVVLYFHGNLENINHYAQYAINFTKHGYEVWMTDYPGYGKTTGKFTEPNVYMQAREVYKLANTKFGKDSIIVYGKSLGSGIASWLASRKPCKRLILETPYYSIPDLFSHYAPIYPVESLSKFKFPTGEYLKDVKIPITIFHGTDDWIIPYRYAAKLKKILKPGDEFITIHKGSHNDLNEFPLFHEKLDSLFSL